MWQYNEWSHEEGEWAWMKNGGGLWRLMKETMWEERRHGSKDQQTVKKKYIKKWQACKTNLAKTGAQR